MRIRLGVDDRLLFSLLAMLGVAGCLAQPGAAKPKKPVAATIEQVAFDSFQKRDVVRAAKLRAIKGTKYDGKRMEAIAKAGAEASEETWRPVAEMLAKKLDAIPQDDQAAFDAVVEQIATAAERAGK